MELNPSLNSHDPTDWVVLGEKPDNLNKYWMIKYKVKLNCTWNNRLTPFNRKT